MGWFDNAKKLKTVVETEKTNRDSLKVNPVCIHGETSCIRCANADYESELVAKSNWESLEAEDLRRIVFEIPAPIREAMRCMPGEAVLAGGFIRSHIANETVHDMDIFVKSEEKAKEFVKNASLEAERHELHYKAFIDGTEVQVIWRYEFKIPVDVPDDFDYTVCKACIWFDEGSKKVESGFRGICHERFYRDIARRELIYCCERDHEQSTGFPRLLKYTQYGYSIGPKSLAEVVTKLCLSLDFDKGFTGLLEQLEAAYKIGGTEKEWQEINKKHVKPKPKPKPEPKPQYSNYDYGS